MDLKNNVRDLKHLTWAFILFAITSTYGAILLLSSLDGVHYIVYLLLGVSTIFAFSVALYKSCKKNKSKKLDKFHDESK